MTTREILLAEARAHAARGVLYSRVIALRCRLCGRTTAVMGRYTTVTEPPADHTGHACTRGGWIRLDLAGSLGADVVGVVEVVGFAILSEAEREECVGIARAARVQ